MKNYQKVKVMKSAPQVSDEEIAKHMNFDALLAERRAVVAKRRTAVLSAGAMILLGSALIVFLLADGSQPVNGTIKTRDPMVERFKEIQEEAPAAIAKDSAMSAPAREARKEQINDKENILRNQLKEHVPEKQESAEVPSSPDSDVYQQAEPVEGYEHLYLFLNQSLSELPVRPDSSSSNLVVSFLITIDGRVDEISLSDSSDVQGEQIISILRQMPAWRPAKVNGKPVRSKVSLPLTFRVQKFKQ